MRQSHGVCHSGLTLLTLPTRTAGPETKDLLGSGRASGRSSTTTNRRPSYLTYLRTQEEDRVDKRRSESSDSYSVGTFAFIAAQ